MINFTGSGAPIRGNPLYDCGCYADTPPCIHAGSAHGIWCLLNYMPGSAGGGSVNKYWLPTQSQYENWTHWAFVRNGSTAQYVYLNGVQLQQIVPSDTLAYSWSTAVFGGYSTSGTLPVPGPYDDFRIYKRALSAGELATLAAAPPE